MQERHLDRQRYFTELANTSREFYIDYISNHFPLTNNCRVLEVGCGDGGNLLPFAEIGCKVTGIDRSEVRISQAKAIFNSLNYEADFISIDFFDINVASKEEKYDIILVHDVIEHIMDKDQFFKQLKHFIADKGVVFWRFPAWQMPFGGHQQICNNRFCSKLPFIHLFPESIYRAILSSFGESSACLNELIEIKRCGISIEKFERLMKQNGYILLNRCLWFINPHYKQKFKMKPRRLFTFISHMRYFRNFFTSSCYYLTKCT